MRSVIQDRDLGRSSAHGGSRRPGSALPFRPQSASSRPPPSSMREAALPESWRQPSPQPYAARLQELEAAVTAKESEAAELRKRMRDMSNEFNAHLLASESGPMEISAGVVNQPRVIHALVRCNVLTKDSGPYSCMEWRDMSRRVSGVVRRTTTLTRVTRKSSTNNYTHAACFGGFALSICAYVF